MARYIDADKLIAHLKDEIKGCEIPFGSRANGKGIAYGTALGLKSAISFAETLSAADVVPKSEVARLVQENDDLKDSNEHLAVMLEETKIELEAMRGAANSYKMHYETAKSEAVKEFAERLKEEACYFGRAVAMEDIDNIAKELIGGGVCETNTTTEK